MRFLTVALLFIVGVLAGEHAPPRGIARGNRICRLIISQNPDLALDDCKSVLQDIRAGCAADYPEADREQRFECMTEGLHAKFKFLTPFQMDLEQRTAFVASACEHIVAMKPEQLPMPVDDPAVCKADMLDTLNTCADQSSNEREFMRCVGEQFHAKYGPPPGEHGGEHGPPHRGGRHHGPHHGGEMPADGEMHIFPGEEGPEEEAPGKGEMHIFPGEEGPEEQARGRGHHGARGSQGRRQHATGRQGRHR